MTPSREYRIAASAVSVWFQEFGVEFPESIAELIAPASLPVDAPDPARQRRVNLGTPYLFQIWGHHTYLWLHP